MLKEFSAKEKFSRLVSFCKELLYFTYSNLHFAKEELKIININNFNLNKKSTQLLLAAAIMTVFLTGTANLVVAQEVNKYPQITDQFCDALNSCSGDLGCYGFPGIGLRCAKPNPCNYYRCPGGTQCTLTASYPGKIICSCIGSECPVNSGNDDAVSFDLSTQTEVRVIKPDGQEGQQNISLWQAGSKRGAPSKGGILESTNISAEYVNELIVKDRQLFMKTSAGEKVVNVMPEDAVSASETPNADLVQKIELKEESEKPVSER